MLSIFHKLKIEVEYSIKFSVIYHNTGFCYYGLLFFGCCGTNIRFYQHHGETLNPWIYKPIRLILIFPVYQILILIFGALFGQFQFSGIFEKKMLARMGFKYFKD